MFVSAFFSCLPVVAMSAYAKGNSCTSDFWPGWKITNQRYQMYVCAGQEIIRAGKAVEHSASQGLFS